jgi:hypothetical protein
VLQERCSEGAVLQRHAHGLHPSLHTHQDSKTLKPDRSNCLHLLFSNVAAPTSIEGANVSQHMPFSRTFSIHILQRVQAPQLLPVDMQHAGQFTRQQEHCFTARPL